jgi:hypothetical protein
VLAVLLAVLLLSFGYARAWPLALDIGGRDARFVDRVSTTDPAHGFHAVEQFGGAAARWSGGDATIALPRPPDDNAAIVSLRLLNSRPADTPVPLLTLSADGHDLGTFEVARTETGPRVYRVLAPPAAWLSWDARFALRTAPISLPGDPRQLGVVVDSVALAPLGAASAPLWLLLLSVALGALAYAMPRSAIVARVPSLALTALLAALLAWGVAARPLEVLPFLQRIAALLALGCLGIWIARLLAPPTPTTDDRRPTNETALRRSSFVVRPSSLVRGVDLPLYLAVAWWMGPLFQAIITADGAQGVSPPVPTAWIGGMLLLALIGLGAWFRFRPTTVQTQDGAFLAEDEHRRAIPFTHSPAHPFTDWALALFAAAAVAHLLYMLWFAFGRQGPDFWILFKGAREWVRGGSLYDLQAIRTNHFGHVFKVPPFYGMLFMPFVFQDGERILIVHRAINAALIGATAICWLRMWRLPLRSAAGAGVLILLNFRPLADTLAFGQIDLALLLILTLTLWALRAERDTMAGVLVALGTLFKIYPLILLAFFAAKGHWRALAGFVLGMLVFNALSILVIGWEMHRVYLIEVLPNIGGTSAWVENQTISGFVARFVAPPTDAVIFGNRMLARLAMAISAGVALLGCVLALGAAERRTTTYALQYGVFLLLMVLVVPAAWMHYETLLFVPFGALLLHLRDRIVPLPRAVALALSFALVAYGNQLSFYTGTVMGILTIAGVSYKFYGMLLLGGTLVATLLEERAPLRLPLSIAAGMWQRLSPRRS